MEMKGMLVAALAAMNVLAADESVMSVAYWKLWNPQVQAKIDADIEANRKADAVFQIPGVPKGTEVKVEQLTHDFIFGAHIFNFDQLGSDDLNAKYKDVFGTLLNSATISFYWRPFEPVEGKPRFAAQPCDTAAFWNTCPNPKEQFNWRRPATDPVVAFCESKGIRLHGHVLAWGNMKWQTPQWLIEKAFDELPFLKGFKTGNQTSMPKAMIAELDKYTNEELAAKAPNYTREANAAQERRIREIAAHYKGRLHSWDVINESATDSGAKRIVPGAAIDKSYYGPLPGDLPYKALQIANDSFPPEVKLNINEYVTDKRYSEQIAGLLARGCRIDIIGAQMHLFNPKQCLDIAAGKPIQTPQEQWTRFALLEPFNRPIHVSEITITAPDNSPTGQAIQAVIARNLYRLWFSVKPMMGITWWNLVDDCGAPGEPSVSGIFNRDMTPKPAYFALNKLINDEWKTRLSVKADKQGKIAFRGFRGTYRLTWQDSQGLTQYRDVHVK